MAIPQEFIDRLIDGELNEEEWRKMVATIPHDNDLARRVALAFIEAQMWSRSLHRQISSLAKPASTSAQMNLQQPGDIIRTSLPMPKSADPFSAGKRLTANVRRRKASAFWLGMAGSLAAGFILAIAVIWLMGPTFGRRGMLLSPPGTEGLAHDTRQVFEGNTSGASAPALPVEMVTIPMNLEGGSTLTTVDIPVISFPDGTQPIAWPGAVIPPQIWEMLPQRGHVIRHERQFVPVRLSDGRQSIIPVDQVEIRFVGQREYR